MMPDQPPLPEPVRAALERVARGEAALDVLASALARTGGMISVVSEDQTAAYLSALAQHRGAETPVPPPAGLPDPDGRPVPRGFTSHEAASAWARANGFAREEIVLLVQGTAWPHALRACVDREDTGLVIDDGTPHAITLTRSDIQHLLALFVE
jgi:hypothetical protein